MERSCLLSTLHSPLLPLQAEVFVDPQEKESLPEVFDDFDLDVTALSEGWRRSVQNSENLRK